MFILHHFGWPDSEPPNVRRPKPFWIIFIPASGNFSHLGSSSHITSLAKSPILGSGLRELCTERTLHSGTWNLLRPNQNKGWNAKTWTWVAWKHGINLIIRVGCSSILWGICIASRAFSAWVYIAFLRANAAKSMIQFSQQSKHVVKATQIDKVSLDGVTQFKAWIHLMPAPRFRWRSPAPLSLQRSDISK